MPPTPEDLATELGHVAKRQIDRLFQTVYGHGPIEAPELYDLVRKLDPTAWEADRTDALREAIGQASRSLPKEIIEDAASLTYRQAALWLFGLDPLNLEHRGGKGYDKIRDYVFESDDRLKYFNRQKRKDVTQKIRFLVARELLKREGGSGPKTRDGEGNGAPTPDQPIDQQILDPDSRPVQIGEAPEDSSVTSDDLPPEGSGEPSDDPQLDESPVMEAVETIIEATQAWVVQVRENIVDYLVQHRALCWGIISVPIIFVLSVLIPTVISMVQDTHHPPVSAQLNAEAMNFTDGKWLSTLYARPGDRVAFALTVKDTGKVPIEFEITMQHRFTQHNGDIFEYVTDSSSVAPTITTPGEPDSFGACQSGVNSPLISVPETLRPGQQVVLKCEFVVDDHIRGSVNTKITPSLLSANASDTNETYQDAEFPVINVRITV